MLDVSPQLLVLVLAFVIIRYRLAARWMCAVLILTGYYLSNTWLASVVGFGIGILFAPKTG